jgi:hypothetical protein
VTPTTLWCRLSAIVKPFSSDQVVVADDVLFAGHGLVVPQEVDGVQVAVKEMPAAVVECLRDAMSQGPGRSRLEPRSAPQRAQADGVIAARVVAVHVEHLDRIAQFAVVPGGVVAIPDFLEPQRKSPFGVGHARRHGRGNDLVDVAEVVLAVGKPRVDDIGLTHVLHPHGPVGLPGLNEGALPRHSASHGGPAIPAVHGASLDHGVTVLSLGDLLDIRSRDVRRVSILGPGIQFFVRSCQRSNSQ